MWRINVNLEPWTLPIYRTHPLDNYTKVQNAMGFETNHIPHKKYLHISSHVWVDWECILSIILCEFTCPGFIWRPGQLTICCVSVNMANYQYSFMSWYIPNSGLSLPLINSRYSIFHGSTCLIVEVKQTKKNLHLELSHHYRRYVNINR